MSSSDLVSLCVLRLEVDNGGDSETGVEGTSAADPARTRGQRRARAISVETFPSRLESPRDDWGLLPAHKSERPPPASASVRGDLEDDPGEIGFFSGNPFVELTKGTLHLYKEDALSSGRDALSLCLLAVPAAMTCHDLLSFTAPCHADIAHIRVLRDSAPNQYMALLTFRANGPAREFYGTYDGAPFNSLEPERVCRAVWVSRVEWAEDETPPPGHTELPTCPVCLERMDESVDGVLTILCNHAFHAGCLLKWGDATCPVCRCAQSPELAESGDCMECGAAAAPDSLWICLICGHVGCGRYQGGHAASHYRGSGHCYALQLGSHRVWDYKGDNFVHRLLQNKADGKLVPAAGPPAAGPEAVEAAQEKVDSVQLEFTYLLTSQLDAQRQYFEERLAGAERGADAERVRLAAAVRERGAADRRAAQLARRLAAAQAELGEERQLGAALRDNQAQWRTRVARLEEESARLRAASDKETADLREQLRDLMFYIDAQRVIAGSSDKEDIAGGTVTVGEPAAPTKAARGRRKR